MEAGEVAEGIDADGVRQYRLNLARAVRRFWGALRVPEARAWEGRVELRLSLDGRQMLPRIELLKSSGNPRLDAEAIDLLEAAARSASLPDGIKGQAFALDFPVLYSAGD